MLKLEAKDKSVVEAATTAITRRRPVGVLNNRLVSGCVADLNVLIIGYRAP